MGFDFTKYGTGNEAIVFDSSKFDYSYDADTFPSDTANDFDEIISEHGDFYSIDREDNVVDGLGKVRDITKTQFRIYGMFQDISIKDRKIHDLGLAVPGSRKFYFKPIYSVVSGGVNNSYTVKEGDIINDSHLFNGRGSTGQYRVVKVIKQWYLPGVEAYRVAIVQSINLDGSL